MMFDYGELRTTRRIFSPEEIRFENGKKVQPLHLSQLDFGEVLAKEIERNGDLKFSAHSLRRLYSRGIRLNDREMLSLLDAVSQIERKKGRNSLIVAERAAFIVNIPNRTVVTAMDTLSLKNNVFTNIDSAYLIS